MNLLTDIIRDVAIELNTPLTDAEALKLQENLLQKLSMDIAWIRHTQIMKEGMPWLEKIKGAA